MPGISASVQTPNQKQSPTLPHTPFFFPSCISSSKGPQIHYASYTLHIQLAVCTALADINTTLAPLLTHETTAQRCQTRSETASVLLLLGGRALLIHGLLVLHGLLHWGPLLVSSLWGSVACVGQYAPLEKNVGGSTHFICPCGGPYACCGYCGC